ncbi:hypothetical protein F4820DRAFT_450632 [Hypoxylon rubiginosum]|uniref:Uncharacterized protein n=1 Tax=Hypoxylon rubiginosum TaxID=110542 RepID=A0ACB9YUB9_9PEZI|nr:hypothetical protein F4820DRAFT_450632 [Hypoxylon rubiginosum]
MSSPSPQTPDDQVVTIDTNNFNSVLKEFNEEGHIINPNTRFQICCGICNEKDLAILNDKFDRRTRETHESYSVLPFCQHAFGHTCLWNWVMVERRRKKPTCPTCRASIFPKGDWSLDLFGDGSVEEQPQDIINIRDSIRNASLLEDDSESDSDLEFNIRVEHPAGTVILPLSEPRPVLLQSMMRSVAAAIDQEVAVPTGLPITDEDLRMMTDAIGRFRTIRSWRFAVGDDIHTEMTDEVREAWRASYREAQTAVIRGNFNTHRNIM